MHFARWTHLPPLAAPANRPGGDSVPVSRASGRGGNPHAIPKASEQFGSYAPHRAEVIGPTEWPGPRPVIDDPGGQHGTDARQGVEVLRRGTIEVDPVRRIGRLLRRRCAGIDGRGGTRHTHAGRVQARADLRRALKASVAEPIGYRAQQEQGREQQHCLAFGGCQDDHSLGPSRGASARLLRGSRAGISSSG